MLYQMNKEAIVQINTPIGNIDHITIEELVRQGTVYGTIFSCASTAKVNDIGEKVVATMENIEIDKAIFMDDINSTSEDPKNIDRAVGGWRSKRNMRLA